MIADIGVGDVVKDTSGQYYKILDFCINVENGREGVVYQSLSPPYKVLMMPINMFMGIASIGASQKYRFEVVTEKELLMLASEERLNRLAEANANLHKNLD